MRYGVWVRCLVFGVAFCCAPMTGWSQGASGAGGRVSQALEGLDRFLGDDENGANWRLFLRWDELKREVAKGEAADAKLIAEIRTIFGGSEAGLEDADFQHVRDALDAWLTELQAPIADLPAAVRAAKGEMQPIPVTRVDGLKDEVERAVAELAVYLDSADAEQSAKWKEAIAWESLQAEWQKGAAAKVEELERFAALLKSDTVGLEAAPFRALRSALLGYTAVLKLVADTKLSETYAGHLEALAKELEAGAKEKRGADDALVGRTLGWLEQAGQVPRIVAETRRRYQQPNLLAEGSEALVAAVFDDPEAKAKLNEPQALQDDILGTYVEGVVYPSLTMNVQLVPSDSQAAVLVELSGSAQSQSTGYRGPVTVFTQGNTSIVANKYVYFDANGVATSSAAASCATATTITGLSARSCLIEKIAWNQAHKQKGQAEAVASAHAEGRISGQMDREMGSRLADAHQNYLDKVRNRLERHDSFPQHLQVSSTEDVVRVEMLHAGSGQLAAGSQPPALSGTHDLAVRLHESAITNFGESLLGGETLTDERLIEILKENNAEIPEELQIAPDKDPWSISFSPEQPLSAVFQGNTAKLAIRGRRFTRGDQVVRAEIEISATYKLEKTPEGSKLTRLEPEVNVDYLNRKQLSVGQVAMKAFLRKKFNAMFKPEIKSDGLKLPERMQSVGKLQLQQLLADNAWLTLSWAKSDSTSPVAAPASAPAQASAE